MRYYSFNNYLRDRFNARVHRLSLNAGFTCPNKDGLLDDKGCIYCNENSYLVYPDLTLTLEDQIKKSIELTKEKYKAEKFIAYFQSGSNTYGPIEKLKETYDVIKKFPEIVGLMVSTRPDCISEASLDLIESFSGQYDVWIEYGMQSIHDRTMKITNRCHTFEQTLQAIERANSRNIKVGLHVILGLPGETKTDMIETARVISNMAIAGVKFHMLYVVENTQLAEMYKTGRIKLLDMDQYVDIICTFLAILPKDCVIFRLVSGAKKEILIAPSWINEKQKVIGMIHRRLEEKCIYQGKLTALNV